MKKETLRILLIEDDPDHALLIEKLLAKSNTKELGFFTVCVDRLETGLDRLSQQNFDLVLLDLTLPDSHGLETFLTVHDAHPSIPVVICSSLNDEHVATEAIRKGAQDYVVKVEMDRPMLGRIIRYALERRRVQEMKEEFVGMVVHELQSPLMVAVEAVSQVADGGAGELTRDQRDLLSMAIRGINRLNHLTEELLDSTKIELGKVTLNKERFDLIAVAKDTAASFRTLAKKRNLELRENFPPKKIEIYADKERIIQILMNLINNALKFTEKGYVEVAVNENEEAIECHIADTGRGIPQGDLNKLFDKFVQFGKKDPDQKGAGLGLAIAKGLITAHNGKIWAESQVPQGSRFTFVLPKEFKTQEKIVETLPADE